MLFRAAAAFYINTFFCTVEILKKFYKPQNLAFTRIFHIKAL